MSTNLIAEPTAPTGSFAPVAPTDRPSTASRAERKCRVCGCTDGDCHQCVEKAGRPCYWVEDDLCSTHETLMRDADLFPVGARVHLGAECPAKYLHPDRDQAISFAVANTHPMRVSGHAEYTSLVILDAPGVRIAGEKPDQVKCFASWLELCECEQA
jgi:hypothetical protein